MGEVYRATDTNLKRQVALKVLPVAVTADPDRLARFQREAEESWPVCSPDGRSIVYSSLRGAQETWRVPADGGRAEKLIDGFFRGDWVTSPEGGHAHRHRSTLTRLITKGPSSATPCREAGARLAPRAPCGVSR